MSRLRTGDLGDSTHRGPEDHGHDRVRCHPWDGLADSLQGCYRLWAQESYRLHTGRYSCCISGGQARYFAPDSIRVQVSGIVSGLASEPYPRGRGETRLRSTLSSLLICGYFSRCATWTTST